MKLQELRISVCMHLLHFETKLHCSSPIRLLVYDLHFQRISAVLQYILEANPRCTDPAVRKDSVVIQNRYIYVCFV